jgi:hypothetical protein
MIITAGKVQEKARTEAEERIVSILTSLEILGRQKYNQCNK